MKSQTVPQFSVIRTCTDIRIGLAWCLLVGWAAIAYGSAPGEVVVQRIYSSSVDRSVRFSELVENGWDGYFYGTGVSYSQPDGFLLKMPKNGPATMVPWPWKPQGGLLVAKDGTLYGTTFAGGTSGLGTIFRITRFQTLTLQSFNGGNGAGPMYTLIQAKDGCLYGVTGRGSHTNLPTIFRATLMGEVTTVVQFPAIPPGLNTPSPCDGLVEGADGWLYGVASGSAQSASAIGCIYRVSTNGTFQTLESFYKSPLLPSGMNGDRPMAGLTAGPDGLLYGSIGHDYYPGATNHGSIFSMTTNGVRTTVVAFNGSNGSNPTTRMVFGNDGALYGFAGTAFRATTNGILTSLGDWAGTNALQGGTETAPAAMMLCSDGNLYGTGTTTGLNPSAIVFRLVQPPVLSASRLIGGGVRLSWPAFNGGTYHLDYKNNLQDTNWTTLGSTLTATGNTISTSDWAFGAAQRYYRVLLLP